MLSSYAIVPLAAFILYGGLLAATLAVDRNSQVNRAFALLLLCMMVWTFGSLAGRTEVLGGSALLWARVLISGCMGVPITLYGFVRAYLEIKERAWLLYLGWAIYACLIALAFASNWIIAAVQVADFRLQLQLGPGGYAVASSWAAVYLFLGIDALRRSYNQSRDPELRTKIRYMLVGTAYLVVGGLASQVPGLRSYPLDVLGSAVNALILAYCMLRYGLLDLSPKLRLLLTYLVLVAVVGGAYLLNFLVVRRLMILYGLPVLWLAAGGVVVLILFMPPLRRAGSLTIERLMFPQRYDMQRMLLRLALNTGAVLDPQTLARTILGDVTATLRIERAGIFLRDVGTGEFYFAATTGVEDSCTRLRWRDDLFGLAELPRERQVLSRAELASHLQSCGKCELETLVLGQLEAQLLMPLRLNGELVGAFAVGPKKSLLSYTSEEKAALSSLARQTVVALDNARLRDGEQRRLSESLALLDIAAATGSTLQLTPLLKLIAQRTARTCGAHRCSILLLDEQQHLLPLMSQYASGAKDARLWSAFRNGTYTERLGEVQVLESLPRERRPIVLEGEAISALPERWVAPFGVHSLLLVPLLSRDRVIGLMALDHVEVGMRFGQAQINLAMTVGSQVAAAIESARLFQQLEMRAKRLALLNQVSMALASTLNLDEILRATVRGLATVFGVAQCGVVIFNEDRSTGQLMAEFPERTSTSTLTIPLQGNQSIERIMATRQPMSIEDAQHDPLLSSVWDVMRQRKVESILIVPLLLRGEVVGTIGLDATSERRVFTSEEMELAQTIANQTSVAMENARLYQQTIEGKAETETILQGTFSGLLVVDDNLRVVSMNPGAEELTGYAAREALGKRLTDVFGVGIAGPDGPLTKAMESGQRIPPMETGLSTRGGTKDILLGVTPLPSTGRPAAKYLLSIMDITRLKEIDRLKSSIVTNVSHELRTPLASIKVYTELLLGSIAGTETARHRDWLSVIERETDRLTALIDDFLDLSRLEAGQFSLRRIPLRLEQVIADETNLLQVQADRRGVRIHVQAQAGLGEILADADLLRIVVKNLISNAIKLSYDNGDVDIRVWEDGHSISFSVSDQGIGIPADAIPRLFTKFFRVPSEAGGMVHGTGLGLALAHEAVTAHGGRIAVESTLGKGSRFTVTLPKSAKVRLDKSAAQQ